MNTLQIRLFLTYLVVIWVTLALTAVSLVLLLGGYRDSITYGNLEDVGRLLDSQAQAELRAATSATDDSPNPGADLLLVLRSFIESRADGAVAPATSLVVVNQRGEVVPGLWAGPSSLDGATIVGPRLDLQLPQARSALPSPVRCRLDPPVGETLLCVTLPLSERVREAFATTEAAALVVAEPGSGVGDVISDIAPRLASSGMIALAAAIVLGFLLSQSVAAPLRNIARAARGVGRGNFRQRVPVTGPREVRDLAANFNRMTGEVERSQQTLRDFLANISHELKTPLTSIRGFSAALRDGTIDTEEAADHALRVIDAESGRVLRLVEELLELSRLESGQATMRSEPISLAELFAHVGDVFSLRSEETGVALEMDCSPGLTVRGDFDRLEQVLNNLLDNAFRHTPPGGAIRVQAQADGPSGVELTVRDTGTGISPEHLPHLFERFYRPAGASTSKGYGLGLAICREIVRAHGGDIMVSSAPGSGTVFRFALQPGREQPRAPGRRFGVDPD